MAQGALVFGAATSDRAVATIAATDSLDPFTVMLLVMPTTLTSLRALYTKGSATTAHKAARLSGTTGNIQVLVVRAGGNLNYITSSTPFATLSVWYCLGISFNSANAANSLVKINSGRMGPTFAALAAATFGTTTDSSGALTSDVGDPVAIGNANGAAPTSAFQGSIGAYALFGAELSLADQQSWQLRPRLTVGSNVAKEFKRYGKDGADGIEYGASGTASTVTGATQGNGCPLYQGGGRWQQRPSGIFQSVA